jgi:hypothetical protein
MYHWDKLLGGNGCSAIPGQNVTEGQNVKVKIKLSHLWEREMFHYNGTNRLSNNRWEIHGPFVTFGRAKITRVIKC